MCLFVLQRHARTAKRLAARSLVTKSAAVLCVTAAVGVVVTLAALAVLQLLAWSECSVIGTYSADYFASVPWNDRTYVRSIYVEHGFP